MTWCPLVQEGVRFSKPIAASKHALARMDHRRCGATARRQPLKRWATRCGEAEGRGNRNGMVEDELIDAIDVVAGTGAGVADGMRAAAWNNDPSVAKVLSALPIRQILDPGAGR